MTANPFDDSTTEYWSKTFTDLLMAGEKITRLEFESCQFKSCDFNAAVFDHCKFIDCEFSNCNLSMAKLRASRFTDVSFRQCKLLGINWAEASWPGMCFSSPIAFYQCILHDASFFSLDLPEIIIEDSQAHDVDFREGDFSEASFSGSDLAGSLFNHTKLIKADFTEATNYDIDIFENALKGAKFSRFEALRLLESVEIELNG